MQSFSEEKAWILYEREQMVYIESKHDFDMFWIRYNNARVQSASCSRKWRDY
ncbi:hypothetical protein E6C60_2379 [Paenibacillus algicola]|uniref:Uncharacterized protein n=1 Tax=Paenibacillus algicola TaxID=2565926 RepID=A0A4P8XNE7_9BACL|nr:hypothetical protein E6C60_2379 [Paenibacillus algicola]